MSRANGRAAAERLPPSSDEAEAGVLGCILLEPACITACFNSHIGSDSFFSQKHRTIWEAMLNLRDRCEPIDIIFLQDVLRNDGTLEDVGGLSFLSGLADGVPSAANLEYYIDLLQGKRVLRRLVDVFTEATGRIYDDVGPVDELIAELRPQIERALTPAANGIGPVKSIEQLMAFDAGQDANTLLGVRADGSTSRYLCRGGAGWLIGPSGVGKSSLAVQMALLWACGRPAFGIRAPRPLRITIIQAENDEGDLAEMVQGVCEGLDLNEFSDAKAFMLANCNLRTRTELTKTGPAFCQWLRRVVEEDKCDLVLLDPFLSFAGIDVSRQGECTNFLRTHLNPVLKQSGVALLGIHHTGKPPKERQKSYGVSIDDAYAGLGSSELTNWSRFTMTIRSIDTVNFELRFAKREGRAGITHPSGEPARGILWLRHAAGRVCWEQIDPPEEPVAEAKEAKPKGRAGRPSKAQEVAAMNLSEFLAGCKEEGEGSNEVARRLVSWLATKSVDFEVSTCRKNVIPLLVTNGKLLKKELNDGFVYVIGPNK